MYLETKYRHEVEIYLDKYSYLVNKSKFLKSLKCNFDDQNDYSIYIKVDKCLEYNFLYIDLKDLLFNEVNLFNEEALSIEANLLLKGPLIIKYRKGKKDNSPEEEYEDERYILPLLIILVASYISDKQYNVVVFENFGKSIVDNSLKFLKDCIKKEESIKTTLDLFEAAKAYYANIKEKNELRREKFVKRLDVKNKCKIELNRNHFTYKELENDPNLIEIINDLVEEEGDKVNYFQKDDDLKIKSVDLHMNENGINVVLVGTNNKITKCLSEKFISNVVENNSNLASALVKDILNCGEIEKSIALEIKDICMKGNNIKKKVDWMRNIFEQCIDTLLRKKFIKKKKKKEEPLHKRARIEEDDRVIISREGMTTYMSVLIAQQLSKK